MIIASGESPEGENVVAQWLQRQTSKRVSEWIEGANLVSYEHPYGFTVVRTHNQLLPGWQIRVHLWPPRSEQLSRLQRNRTENQKVHAHGWRICSVVLRGALEECSFVASKSSASDYDVYRVDSDYGAGISRLSGYEFGVQVKQISSTVRTPETGPYLIPSTQLHSTMSADEVWSVSLVATELRTTGLSYVVAPTVVERELANQRRPSGDLAILVKLLAS